MKPIRGAQPNRSNPLARGLFNCWLFNEGGGDQVFDVAEGGLGSFGPGASWTVGPKGSVINLGPDDGYVILVNGAAPRHHAPSGFSFAIRLLFHRLPSTAPGTPILLDCQKSGGIRFWYLRGQTWNDQFSVAYYSPSGSSFSAASGFVVTLYQWYSVVFVFDGANGHLYIDGVKRSTSGPSTIDEGTASLVRLGHAGTNSTPDAEIEYVMFWDRPLTEAEASRVTMDPYSMFGGTSPIALA